METARILLGGGGQKIADSLYAVLSEDGVKLDIQTVQDEDDILTALVSFPYELCILRTLSETPEFAIQVCKDARQSGIRIPVVVLMDLSCTQTERDFLNAGAIAAITWDGTQGSMLRNLMRMTLNLRATQENLRKTNDRLVQEMITMQDERERAEALNAQYVELAENYALAKEELEKLNQEKNKFFSIIAHDLRSPFTSLMGYTNLLKAQAENLSTEQVKDFANTIDQSANRVFKLLETLLEWAQLQMDRVDPQPDFITLNDIAQQTVEVLGPVATEKGLTLTQSGDALKAYADPNMIDTVIRNLVNNAIKFTPEGGTITIGFETTPFGKAKVLVTDTGVGMSTSAAKKVFSLTDNVTTRGTNGEKGTGLGLTLCKELVELNAGLIDVTSQPNAGSTFSFTLPQEASEKPKKDEEPKAAAG
ncbi:HAMP domain-containing sensor histidine kinase [Magnetovibrio sp. PR-2]|uniref:sensor histidine kinase n=1 Tax=Magnetovibrio sp. PR-2 TaxID=3120356 RepID=UPI002FCE4A1F